MKQSKNLFEKPILSVEDLSHALYETSLQLEKSNQQLKKQEQQRKEFYTNISHDLRAPITAINNSIEYLLSDNTLTKEDIHTTLLMIQKRSDHLVKLINDIFLLSSLESVDENTYPAKLHKEPVDIAFFLEDYFYMCEADNYYSSAELTLDLPDTLDLTMELDPTLMHRVLDNLFTNAIKYTSSKPSITLGAYQEKHSLFIYVQDHGIGIAKKHLNKIFDRSFIVTQSRTPSEQQSNGFGLSIVKAIIELHHGTIKCESTLGVGSRFIMQFPIL